MASATCPSSVSVYRGRVAEVVPQPEAIHCLVADRGNVRLPLLLASHIAIGDEITFAIPAQHALGTEIYVTKAISSRMGNSLYLAPIGYVTQPKSDKRHQSFVSAKVQQGDVGISAVFLRCDTVREYFYGVGDSKKG